MSDYYHLRCKTHKEYTDAVSRTLGGYTDLAHSKVTLQPFMIWHCSPCELEIQIIDFPEDLSDYLEWTPENYEDLYVRP